MITTTGKLENYSLEYIGASQMPKLKILVSANGKMVPFAFIGDKALNAIALLGDGTNGSAHPGTLIRLVGEPSFRRWDGDEARPGRTFTEGDLSANELMVLGTSGLEDSTFTLQGVLHGLGSRQGGEVTYYSCKLRLAQYKKGELVEDCDLELDIHKDSVMDYQRAIGSFVVVSGEAESFTWTAKSGTRAGEQQRSLKLRGTKVHAISTPSWIAGHDAFGNILGPVAPAAPVYTAPPVAAPSATDLPLF